MLTRAQVDTTPFKALKELSNSKNDFLKNENIFPELEYTNALKELLVLRNQVESLKDKEEQVKDEIQKLKDYNQKMELLELNISNLQVKIKEYSLLLKDWELTRYKFVIGVIGLMSGVMYYFFK